MFNTSKIQFESKSQLGATSMQSTNRCVQYVKDTIWKQITTSRNRLLSQLKLCSIRQRYNLKANHNKCRCRNNFYCVVFNTSKIQFESKSQHHNHSINKHLCCVQYVKDTIWKQITTQLISANDIIKLCSIRQRYNLKANHN